VFLTLKGHWHEKSVSKEHVGGDAFGLQYEPLPYLKFYDHPFKSSDFGTILLHYIWIEIYPLPPIINFGGSPQISGKSLWQAADHLKNPVCTILPASSVGKQTEGKKLAFLLSPWQPLVKLLFPGGRGLIIKIGRGHTGYKWKSWAEPRTRYKIICGPGPQIKRFLHQ
jgi:hypothetical protein